MPISYWSSDVGSSDLLDRIDDMREEARVGFPTAEMRQRIVGKVEAAQQCGLIGLAPAPQRAQQPRPLDRAEGDDLQPFARRARQGVVDIGMRQELRRFATCHPQPTKGGGWQFSDGSPACVRPDRKSTRLNSNH